jgi:hypothetical protein
MAFHPESKNKNNTSLLQKIKKIQKGSKKKIKMAAICFYHESCPVASPPGLGFIIPISPIPHSDCVQQCSPGRTNMEE